MSLFTMVSDGVVARVSSFEDIVKLAADARLSGHRVSVHRSTPAELALISLQATRGWAVALSMGGRSDVLRCMDEEEARALLPDIRAYGVTANIVRL